jgi:iron complex outermembrane receptor protein
MQIPTGSALYNKYMPGGTDVLDPTAVYGDDLYAYWRGSDVGDRVTKDHTKALHFAASLTGSIANWDYTTAYTHSENKWVESYEGGWLKQNEQDAAIASGAFDPFLLPGQQSAAGVQALAGMQYRGVFKSEKSTLDAFELRGSRAVFSLPGGQAQLGLGADFRRENVKYNPSEIAQGITNTIAGDTAQEAAYDVSRKVWGIYSELVAPVTKQLELDAALRHDHYGDFGSTDNAKLSARFQPAKEVLIRGSFGTGFRAPSVPQVAAGRQLYGVTGSTYNCPAAALAALKAIDAAAVCPADGSQYSVLASGNPNLRPEKSQQFSLGVRLEPVNWASLGVDYWHVDIKDRITQLTESTVMASDAQYLKNFGIFVDPGTHRHLVALYLPNENLGKERYDGVDIDGRLVFNTPIGKLTNDLKWTHIFSYDYQRVRDGDWFSNLGAYNDGSVTFKNIIRLSSHLRLGNFEHTLAANYKSGYKDEDCTAADCGLVRIVRPDGTVGGVVDMVDHRVSSYTTFDWQTKYTYQKMLTLTFGIFNLFDRNPPLSLKTDGGHQLGYDNRYTDPRGRTVYVTASYKF